MRLDRGLREVRKEVSLCSIEGCVRTNRGMGEIKQRKLVNLESWFREVNNERVRLNTRFLEIT